MRCDNVRCRVPDEDAPIDSPSDPELLARLMPPGYRARPEQAILFTVEAWDTNCPQHIPQRFEAADVASALQKRETRIAELEAEVRRLKGEPSPDAG